MAAGESLTVQMSGGGPWGFRLYGGDDDPLVVAKLRKRSKAHEAGLQEGDVILALNGFSCQGINHSTAMGIVETTGDLGVNVLRGASDHNAINAAFQTLGSQLRPVPASAVPQGGGTSSGQGVQYSAPAPQASPAQHTQPQAQQDQIVNGYAAPSVPKHFSRQEKTYQEGDRTTHVSMETSQEQHGGTTITKVKRETVTQSYGQQAAKPMFQVSDVSGVAPAAKKPGIWTPSGGGAPKRPGGVTVSAPSGVHVQQNQDQSVTMTIGMHQPMEESKENIAPGFYQQEPSKPVPPMFKVSKFDSSVQHQPKPKPKQPQWQPGHAPASRPHQGGGEIPLLPDEEEEYAARLEALKKPFPVQLQKILIEGGSGSDSGSDSPGGFARRRIDSNEQESDDDFFNKKKLFADSAFYDDPEHKYPTIEEQVKMARKVAMSLLAPANKKARGHRMFMRRMVKSQKWTTDKDHQEHDFEFVGDEEEEEKYYKSNPWETGESVWQPMEPAAPTGPVKPPAPPPIPTNFLQPPTIPTFSRKDEKSKSLSAEEFERMRLFESKTDHTQVSPQMCFDLAQDLRNMKGKGGKLFAKRVARAEKWNVDADDPSEGVNKPNLELINKIAMQAAASGAPQLLPVMNRAPKAPAAVTDDGSPVNRLKDMVNPPKPKMSPWDAAASSDGNIDQAFEHLREYRPYGRSQKGEIADNLGKAVNRQGDVAPVSHLPTSGQPAKLPEFTRKIKPWGSGSDSEVASGASFSNPAPVASQPAAPRAPFASQPAAPTTAGGFRPVSFKAPGGAGNFGGSFLQQPAAPISSISPTPSGGSIGGGSIGSGAAASFGGGEEVGYCDL